MCVKKNLQDKALIDLARTRVLQARKTGPSTDYVDRASQRRTLFNQPDAPVQTQRSSTQPGGFKRKFVEGPSAVEVVKPSVPVPLGLDQNNVGNKLLASGFLFYFKMESLVEICSLTSVPLFLPSEMGWKDGQGKSKKNRNSVL